MRILVVLCLLIPVLALAAPHHSLVEVRLDAPGDEARFRAVAGELDVLMVKPGSYAEIAATPRDLAILARTGLLIRVVIEDMEAAVVYPGKGPGFGIYHTWSESVAWMDSLRLLYPHVVSEKWSLGTSLEGRDIWAFRVSDNPDLDEGEPEVLIDGMHHGREIMAAEFPVMFAEHLAQNYGTDAEITWLLDNRELYVVPIVNADGFVYNETIEPDGGGTWRKNRRDNGDGTFGVDPNRNYTYQWGYDDLGSSPDPASNTYRGAFAGSEPEIQAMMAFINGREFRTHASVHTRGGRYAYPWGYDDIAAPDQPALAALATEMARENGYIVSSSYDWYANNGSAKDWSYWDQGGHGRIFCLLVEIGRGGWIYWPPEAERGPLFRENLHAGLELMRAAGAYVVADSMVATANPAKDIAPGESGLLSFRLRNHSVIESSPPLTVTVRTDDPWLQLGAAQHAVGALSPLAVQDLASAPLPFTVDPACPGGHVARLTVTVPLPGGDREYPLIVTVGSPEVIFYDDLESGTGNWILDPPWGTFEYTYHSWRHCLTDNPDLPYGPDLAVAATLAGTWRATGLDFWQAVIVEDGWDFGRVQVSPDGGPWMTVASFTGEQAIWRHDVISLAEFYGQELGIRFLLETDSNTARDGWYIDDVAILGVAGANLAPPVPVPDPTSGTGPDYELVVATGADPEGDAVVCGFRIYADALQTQLVAAVADLPANGGQAVWQPPALAEGDYWWRAWAGDGEVRSDLCPAETFTVIDVSTARLPGAGTPSLQVLDTGSGRARLRMSLPAAGDVQVTIYDVRGARVRELHRGWLDGGVRTLVWNGRDQHGRAAASGVYFVRATVAGRHLTDRLVLVR